jgi:hypothetical protein
MCVPWAVVSDAAKPKPESSTAARKVSLGALSLVTGESSRRTGYEGRAFGCSG